MSWARLDDEFYDHPKVLSVGLEAVGVYALALSYAGRHLTDGWIEKHVGVYLARGRTDVLEALVGARLWEETADGTGYHIHDFLQLNPSANTVKHKRKSAKKRMQALRSRSREQVDTRCLGDGTGRVGKKKSGSGGGSAEGGRGTRIPDGALPDAWRAFAVELRLDADAVYAEFVDFWHGVPGQRGRKSDWPGTWRNRCRELAGRGRKRPKAEGYEPPPLIREAMAREAAAGAQKVREMRTR